MDAIVTTALSGLNAATRRLETSARNVANFTAKAPASPEGPPPAGLYRPERVVQTSTAAGTRAETVPVVPAAFTVQDSASPTGFSAVPNVDLAEEAVNQIVAQRAYEANLAVLKTKDEMDRELVDTFA